LKNYYAVRKGRIPGIYRTWDECKEQVMGFSSPEYKGFSLLSDAQNYMNNSLKTTDTKSDAVAYVDGSYSKDANMFSYGAVIFYNGEKYEFCKAFQDPELITMHNVAGEIKGSEFVMQYCIDNGIKSVDIFYDYEGIEKWCSGEWKTNKSGTQKYKQFYTEVSKNLKVNFIKVRGHSGDEYNDLADALAKSALGIN
jgi:ribonuclease HI